MAGSGPLNSENIAGYIENLDKALDEAEGRAELYLAGGARMLFGWRTDRHTSDLDGVMRTGQAVLTTALYPFTPKSNELNGRSGAYFLR